MLIFRFLKVLSPRYRCKPSLVTYRDRLAFMQRSDVIFRFLSGSSSALSIVLKLFGRTFDFRNLSFEIAAKFQQGEPADSKTAVITSTLNLIKLVISSSRVPASQRITLSSSWRLAHSTTSNQKFAGESAM